MRFRVDQRFDAPPAAVIAVYTDVAFYETLTGLSRVGPPEVLSCEQDGDRVRLRIRYIFTADLPSAALAVIDPQKLTWVEDTTYDLATNSSTTKLRPDHYADRLTASARAAVEAVADDPPRSARRVDGDLSVRMPFVGGQVEKAIVSGLREHLADEAAVAARWLLDER